MNHINAIKNFFGILASIFVVPTFALAAPFTFASMGDTQDISDQGQGHLNRLIESVNQRQHSFIVHAGELKGGGD